MSGERFALVKVFSPDTEGELVTIVEMLEARQVPCFVCSGRPVPVSARGERRVSRPEAIMVPAERRAEAVGLIGEFLGSSAAYGEAAREPSPGRLRALLRLIWFRGRVLSADLYR